MAIITESSYDGSVYRLVACTGIKPRRVNFKSYDDMQREFDRVNQQIEKYINDGKELIRVKNNPYQSRDWFIWNETNQLRISSHKTQKEVIQAFDEL